MNYYLGIDLHKRSSTWCLLDENKNICEKRTVACNPDELQKAVNDISFKYQNISVAVEPVCGYRWVVKMLRESGLSVAVANPLKVRLIADSRIKCDSVDAQTLAELLKSDFLPTSYFAPENVTELRGIIRERQYLVQKRTGLKNRIKAVVTARGFHEIIDSCLKQEGIGIIKYSGDRELNDLTELVQELGVYIKRLEKQISEFIKEDETAKLLMTIPVVGTITAATIIAEVGDFSRFSSPGKLTNYAGLIPSQRSSGEKQKYGRITKVGSKYLRHACVESAMRLREHHDLKLYSFYEKIKKSHSPMKARVALARKMLTICWYMVKNNEPFKANTPVNDNMKLGDLVRPF